jgi:hypothetical protein
MPQTRRGPYRKKPALDPQQAATLPLVDYLRASVTQLEECAERATESGSWQAVSALKLRALQTRADLDAAIEKANRPDESMSDEQLLGIIVQAVAQLPPQHLERIEEAVAIRRGGSPLRLVKTGTDDA